MKGNVKAISVENNAALVEYSLGDGMVECWLALEPHVKMSYVKKGDCEFTANFEDKTISFIKCGSGFPAKPTQAPNFPSPNPGSPKQFDNTSMYVSYAKDIFNQFLENKKGTEVDVIEMMRISVDLVKQAKKGFE